MPQPQLPQSCLRFQAGVLPYQERSCLVCNLGPCELLPKPSRPKDKPTKPKRPPKDKKSFPRMRTAYDTWYDTGVDGASFWIVSWGPMTYQQLFAETNTIDHLWMSHRVSYIVELNRLSNSRSCQVLQQRLSVPSYLLDLGPTQWYTASSPDTSQDDPDIRYWSAVTERYLASYLTNAITRNPYEYEDSHLHLKLDKELDVAEAMAFDAMRPEFKTGFSTLNFLYEMSDIVSPLENLVKGLESIKDLIYRSRNVMLGRENVVLFDMTLNELASAVANGHLTWEFGIKPLFGDLERVCTIIDRFHENVRRFMDGAKSLGLKRHFQAFIQPTTETMESVSSEVDVDIGYHTVKYRVSLDGFEPMADGTPLDHMKYNATMEFTYACETLAEMDSYIAALYQSLGVKPDASIIWNAIPFSFVVDWFVDVGGFLDKYASVDLIQAQVTIHQWITGIKSRPRWKCVPVSAVRNAPAQEDPVLYAMPEITLYGQLYSRLVGIPDVDQLVAENTKTPDGLTLKRGLLSASLVKQLLPVIARRRDYHEWYGIE